MAARGPSGGALVTTATTAGGRGSEEGPLHGPERAPDEARPADDPRAEGTGSGRGGDRPRTSRREMSPDAEGADGSGPRTADRPYPVVSEAVLPHPRRKWWREVRDPADLPILPPGCVYVFGVNGRFQQCLVEGRLRGTEPEFVEAQSVSVVDVRPRQVTANLLLPSASAETDFLVRVAFDCRVESAATVAGDNVTDLRGSLQAHLKQDPRILQFQHRYGIGEIDEVRRQVVAYLLAAYRQRPPAIDGMRVGLADITVLTPPTLRRHAGRMRDKRWEMEEQHVDHLAEEQRVAHNRKLISTAENAEAAAVARGQKTAGEAADRMFEDDRVRQERLHTAYTGFIEDGRLDRNLRHHRAIAEAGLANLVGRADAEAAPSANRPAISPRPAEPRSGSGRGDGADEDDELEPFITSGDDVDD